MGEGETEILLDALGMAASMAPREGMEDLAAVRGLCLIMQHELNDHRATGLKEATEGRSPHLDKDSIR